MVVNLSQCPAVGDLERLLAEQLSSPERDSVETHVEGCPSCQERLARLASGTFRPIPSSSAVRGERGPDEGFLRRLREIPPPTVVPGGGAHLFRSDEQPASPLRPAGEPAGLEHQRLGQYEILEKLGAGGMGAVYLARHVELGKVVALKVLPAGQMDEVSIARFKNEIRAIGRLDHPHIVAAHDAGESGGVHYLVMDFVDGVDLAQVLREQRCLRIADACEAIRQAAIALQHAYERGLVHRDVKPSNLMLARGGSIKLLDLGLARSFGDTPAETLTAKGMLLGTADYLAPEQWEHPSAVDIRADIYGLGCTLYHLLAGLPPFAPPRYGTVLTKMRGHLEEQPPPIGDIRSEVPAELAAVLDRMMAKAPADRYATPAAVAEALAPFAAGADLAGLLGQGAGMASRLSAADTPRPVQALAETRIQSNRPAQPSPARRRRYLLPLAMVGLCLLLAVAAVSFWPGLWRSPPPAPKPLEIEQLRVNHFRGRPEKLVGDIRSTAEEIRVRDAVRVYAKLSEPAYCYLIAFNPDSTEQLCHPAWEENNPAQARAVRPEKVTEVRFFPKETDYFALDSAGLQVFVLVASTKPLPTYAEWRAAAGAIPWRVVRHGGDRRWQFDGRAFTPLPVERGFRQEGEAEPKALRELCDFFKNRPEVEAVQVIAFPVVEADRARQLNAKSLELCREEKYTEAQEPIRELIALLTRDKGKDHFETLDAKRELQALKQVAALPAAARAEYTEALKLIDRIAMLQKQGRYVEALPLAKRALEVLQRHLGPEHLGVALSAHQYGQLLHRSARYAEAERLFLQALKIVRREMGEDHPTVAKCSGDLALNLDAQGKHAEAKPLHDAALKLTIRLRGEEHADTAVAYNNLAGHFGRQSLLAEAEALYRKALAILLQSEGEDGLRVAVARDNLAFNLNAQGKYVAAEAMYRQVLLARLKSLGEDHPDTAMSFNGLAINLDAQGNHADAESLIRKTLDIYRRKFGEENTHTAVALNNLAMNLQHQAKYAEAEPLFETALAIQRRAAPGGGKSQDVAVVHNNRAANLQAQGKVAEAQKELEQALESFRAVLGEDHPDVALALNNLAAILDAQKKYAEAEPLLRKALEILQARLGQEHPLTVRASINRAINLHNQGKYQVAAPQLEEALEVCRRMLGEGHPSTAWAYLKLVINCWARGDYQKAEELGAAAAASFEAARPWISFAGLDRVSRADDLSPYRFLAAVAARNGNPAAAWCYLENSLARGLLDDLMARQLSDEERAREQQLLRDIDRLDRQVAGLLGGKAVTDEARKEAASVRRERDAAQAKLVQLQAELVARHGMAAGKVYDLPALQKELRPDAALVTWVDISGDAAVKDPNGEHWACVVRHEGDPVWVRLPGGGPDGAWADADDELPSSVRRPLGSRADVSKGQWKDLASKLHAQRLAPVEKHLGPRGQLPAVRHLIVLPSPQMAGIPIEALLSSPAPKDHFTVSYAPSGTMFARLQEQRDQAKRRDAPGRRPRLLALGDPAFQRADSGGDKSGPATAGERVRFASLPATRKELQAIARVFDQPELLMGSAASEQNLDRMAAEDKLREFRFLHFATHGVLDDHRALHSALVLAQDQLPEPLGQVLGGQPAYDGRLTAEQILRSWKLDADLVTLSACDTGLGKYSRSEGFLGFSQALFLAGARGMVLSLWPVDDRATALLMARFYENVLDEKAVTLMPKAEALAEAKRWLHGLSAEEVERLTADLPRGLPNGTRGVRRSGPPAATDAPRPFEHPYYWSAFILIGDPR